MRNLRTSVPRALAILKCLSENGEMRTTKVAEKIGMNTSFHASTVMAQLQSRGFVSLRKENARRFYSITELGRSYLEQFVPKNAGNID
jgi:predicted transcriptional regulator